MNSYTGKEISSLRIGTVTAVRGRRIEVTVDADKNDSSLIFQGEIISNVSIGSFLVVRRGYAHLVVQVEEEELVESSAWENSDYQRDVDRNTRILKTSLLGEFQKDTSVPPFQTHFVSGSQTSPLIGNIAYLASPEQASKIYVSSSAPSTQITIGHLATDSTIPINLDISTFFSSHIGIFGNAGSGKSCTLTQIYTQLLNSIFKEANAEKGRHNSRFILFDFSGDYCRNSSANTICGRKLKSTHHLHRTTQTKASSLNKRIQLPDSILRNVEFWINILEPTNSEQRSFILRCLKNTLSGPQILPFTQELICKFFSSDGMEYRDKDILISFLAVLHNSIKPKDSAFDARLEDFSLIFKYSAEKKNFFVWVDTKERYAGCYDFNQRVKSALVRLFGNNFAQHAQLFDSLLLTFKLTHFFEFSFDAENTSRITPLINRFDTRVRTLRTWFDFNGSSSLEHRPVQIIDLAHATPDDRTLIPLVITFSEYTSHKLMYGTGSASGYLNFIFEGACDLFSDEIHTNGETRHNPWLTTFENIMKEGKRLGSFITIVSQRPAEISLSITSQLHHYLLHRLVNPIDFDCVKNAVMFLDAKSFDELSSLPRGTCIISGTSVQIPAIVKIDELPAERRPDNETIDLVKLWGLAPVSSLEAANTEVGSVDTQESESTAEES